MSFSEDRLQHYVFISGLAEWSKPTGGMFLWIKLLKIKDSSRVVVEAAKRGAVFNAGTCFTFDGMVSNCIRASYSIASDEQMDKVMREIYLDLI